MAMIGSDFNVIADVISSHIVRYPAGSMEILSLVRLANAMALEFKKNNPRFNPDIFIYKCKITGGE